MPGPSAMRRRRPSDSRSAFGHARAPPVWLGDTSTASAVLQEPAPDQVRETTAPSDARTATRVAPLPLRTIAGCA